MRFIKPLLPLLLLSAPAWACGTAPIKLFFSNVKSTTTGLTTAGTLVSGSGSQVTATSAKTAKLTSTWFQMVEGTTSSASVAGDSSTADAKGWENSAGSIPAGCSIPAGSWTFSAQQGDSSGAQTGSVTSAHVYTCVGSTCTSQCNVINNAVSMSTTVATKTATGSCPQIDFAGTAHLYVEIYYEVGTNSSTSTTSATTWLELGANDFVSFPQDITTPAGGCAQSIALLGVGCR